MPAKFPEIEILPPHDADSENFAPGRRGSMNGNSQLSNAENNTAFQNLNNDPSFGVNRQVNHDEIVISGISARLPESDNLQEFHDNLFNGVDMITDDGRRWTPGLHGLPARSGKLKELDKFDATFFGVHAKQANLMDPQLRMLLELTYEAIVDAGVNPSSIRGSRTGVFIGASASESDEAWSSNPDEVNGYGLTGCCRAMFANRISFTFDLKGPSFAIDTACSSSLLALEQAVSAIRMGHCDAAIVGGVNLCLKPTSSLQFHRLSVLSPEGKCKAFDAAGNDYVRSEAAVAIYIRKSDFARRSYATILHAKTNTDGYKEQGITFPSGYVQKTLLEEIYSEAGVSPSQVGYVEAHGTGTKVGDPEELNAIAEVFCKDRDPTKPLLIGSVKSNMGHSEPASGLCSIAKVILAMQKGVIPGNLHFIAPNPAIAALNDGRFKVVSQNTPWEGGIVGVNSFGFGGPNVHVILKTNPKKTPGFLSNSTPLLIPYSGRTKEAVEYALKQVSSRPRDDELVSLLQEISREDIPGHQYRGYAVVRDDATDLDVQQTNNQGKPPVWFVFSGMGSQWSGMGRDLLQFKVFETSIRRSAETLTPHGIDLTDILLHGNEKSFDNVLNAFVSIAAIQVGLVDLLRSLGISPDGIIGHSVGELGCAYADGCFTAEETVMAAYARGKAILESKLPPGGMAAVGLTWEDAKVRCPVDVFPAFHNAKDSVSVSGPIASIREFVEKLKSEGIFAKEVNSSGHAFHSKYIADARSKLRESLEKIIRVAKPRTERWISSSIPESSWNSALAKTSSVAYHVNNLLSPVLFQEALAHVPDNGLVIEIAPHCLLQTILKRSVSSTCTNIGLMHRTNPDNAAYFLNSVGKMFSAGIHPAIGSLYKKMEFPVSIGASLISPLLKWDHSISWDVVNFSQYRSTTQSVPDFFNAVVGDGGDQKPSQNSVNVENSPGVASSSLGSDPVARSAESSIVVQKTVPSLKKRKQKKTLTPEFVDDSSQESSSDDFQDPRKKNQYCVNTHPVLQQKAVFKCKTCPYETHKKYNLSRHELGHRKQTFGTLQCPHTECKQKFTTMKLLDDHLENVHQQEMKVEAHNFITEEEFHEWLNKLCSDNSVQYNKYSKHGNRRVYLCHRSGFHKSVASKRLPKKLGSIKIQHVCTSRVEATQMKNSTIQVKYHTSHSTHKIEIGRVKLVSPQKHFISAQLASGVPPQTILEKIRNNNVTEVKRYDLTTLQDIKNVARRDGISSQCRLDLEDAASVDAKLKLLQAEGDSGVLVYKPQGVMLPEYPEVAEEDFLLGYMNSAQADLAEEYLPNIVCIDGTHGTNAYGFEMTTVLTIQDDKKGFPVAFFFHSRKSQATYNIFFQRMKERLGGPIETSVFMSDDEPAFYNSWVEVMGKPSKKLLCLWHIHKNWTKHLGGVQVPLRNDIDVKLRAVAAELSILDFDIALQALLHEMSNTVELSSFFNYISTYYLPRKEEWALCYRIGAGINTNMCLERLHKELKHKYLNGKRIKRLDEGFAAVLRLLKDMQYSRLVAIFRGSVATTERVLRRRHIESLKVHCDTIVTCGSDWVISSSSNIFVTYKLCHRSTCVNCPIACQQCSTCFHEYSCSCYDYCIRANMCKHLHVLQRYLKSSSTNAIGSSQELVDTNDDVLVIDSNTTDERRAREVRSHVGALQKSLNSSSASDELKMDFSKLLALISCPADEKVVKDCLRRAHATIAARKSIHDPSQFVHKYKVNTNARVDKQLKFHKKVKPKTKKSHHNYSQIVSDLMGVRMNQDEAA